MSTSKLTEEQLKWIGRPQFHKSIMYAYNRRTHSFYFYTPVEGGREIVPIGVFSPIGTEDIPYDPQAVVELIADTMSRDEGSYDFDLNASI